MNERETTTGKKRNRMQPDRLAYGRFERSGHIAVPAGRDMVFPLLCPVREYEWIPDWACTMGYSESGAAEKDVVFRTNVLPGFQAVWTGITYDPPSLVEYLIVIGTSAVIRLSIGLGDGASGSSSSDLEWTMKFTLKKGFVSSLIERRYSEKGFNNLLKRRERELRIFFENRSGSE